MTRLARRIALALLLCLLPALPVAAQAQAQAQAQDDDPYLWLEDVTGDKPLAWVKARNAESTKALSQSPEFAGLEKRLLAILDSDDRIPNVRKLGSWYYNFWRDAAHPRGVWRRTTLDEYRKSEPKWDTVIDLDALAKTESENWVWSGADCLKPEYRRCLVSLSRGGADAAVTREFDVTARTFVADGFILPEAKATVSWRDLDSLFVGTDFGAGSLTESGYPRIIKEWKRGTALAEAPTVFEAKPTDVRAFAFRDLTPGFERDFVIRGVTFWTSEMFLRRNGRLIKLDKPDDAQLNVHRDLVFLTLRSDWKVGEDTVPAGALLVADFDKFVDGKASFEVLFKPTERTSLEEYEPTRNYVLLNELDNVRNRLSVLTRKDGKWKREPLPGLPEIGSFSVSAIDPDESDDYFVTTSDYVTPDRLLLGTIGKGAPETLKSLPAQYKADGLVIGQHETKSKDGTRIPYFQVSRRELPNDGRNPTLLYGYGGFEVPMLPRYSSTVGAGWLEPGGVYVVANIRGGGEFGPKWHNAALKQNRHKAYEDFIAVGEDLVRRKVTSPDRLGTMGGSNGGLLMGNMLTMRPDLFGAIVCQVPLLDMRRYDKLLAGASWVGEYGDPDDPAQWAFVKTFSPYHNVRKDVTYPPTLFTTSTRDDRVHPGHARKMAARMLEQGHPVTYYENIEGGHGGAANNAQRAFMSALAYRFLWTELQPNDASTASAAKSDGTRTLKGEFTWSQRNQTGDIEAIFTPTGDGTWDVAFHFNFRDQPHVYAGTASGQLSAGELQGTVQNENKQRTFRFRGRIEDGKFEGRHAEVDGTDEQETGTLTLDIAG
jgi:prolyl oligopeptidase